VSAGHRQHVTSMEHVVGQPLRAAGVANARVQNRFHQRVAARDHIAHHKDIGLQGQLVGGEPFDQFDAQGAQLIAHGWVDIGVAASHPVTRLASERGQPAHERATNTEDVKVHVRFSRAKRVGRHPRSGRCLRRCVRH